MEKYTKINTMYCRYVFDGKECPNKKWLKMRNKIILGEFSDKEAEYLFDCQWEAYSKVDGTNSKIAYFPSTQEIRVEGKDENSQSQKGQFEYLAELGEKIKPMLMEMYPHDMMKFSVVADKTARKPIYHKLGVAGKLDDIVTPDHEGDYVVSLEEVPIYIYGEYYGEGIQKCGKRYFADKHAFAVFDIKMQGWWVPKDYRDEVCQKLGLEQVPFLGVMTLREIEKMVMDGFTTKVEGVSDPTLMEEGIVARPVIPLKNGGGNRLIVKVKSCDYNEYAAARSEFTDEEFKEFTEWYNKHKLM